MEQTLGSISSLPSIIKYDDGYWASIVSDNEITIISSDIPPVRCSGGGECSLELVELSGDIVAKVTSILGVSVEKMLMLCANIMGVCSGISIKIFSSDKPEEVAGAFSRGRGEVFKLLAETYGSA